MISKEEYVLNKVKILVNHYVNEGGKLNSSTLQELIEQWSFDYDIEKESRPEILEKEN